MSVNLVFLTNVRKTDVVEELVQLAAKHTNVKAEYRPYAYIDDSVHSPAVVDAMLKMGSIWVKDGIDVGDFWYELTRLERVVTQPLNEPVLPDDHPIHQGYLYIANGVVTEFIDGMTMTVGRWKSLRVRNVEPVTEVRRCDRVGRRLRLPEVKESPTAVGQAFSSANPVSKKVRRQRKTHKIRNAM